MSAYEKLAAKFAELEDVLFVALRLTTVERREEQALFTGRTKIVEDRRGVRVEAWGRVSGTGDAYLRLALDAGQGLETVKRHEDALLTWLGVRRATWSRDGHHVVVGLTDSDPIVYPKSVVERAPTGSSTAGFHHFLLPERRTA